jgi:urease accessory protein
VTSALIMLLADGRLPAGGHAHSGGLEAAVAAGRVTDLATLEAFLRGRLATAGLTGAAFAAAATIHAKSTVDIELLDAELDARTPSPALRKASRQQGRALLRVGRAMFRLPAAPASPHQPVALGIVAAAAGLAPADVAAIAAYHAVSGPASAAVRLLALDPYLVQEKLARLATACDETAARATAHAAGNISALPSANGPLLDISAEVHAAWEVRLFAS